MKNLNLSPTQNFAFFEKEMGEPVFKERIDLLTTNNKKTFSYFLEGQTLSRLKINEIDNGKIDFDITIYSYYDVSEIEVKHYNFDFNEKLIYEVNKIDDNGILIISLVAELMKVTKQLFLVDEEICKKILLAARTELNLRLENLRFFLDFLAKPIDIHGFFKKRKYSKRIKKDLMCVQSALFLAEELDNNFSLEKLLKFSKILVIL